MARVKRISDDVLRQAFQTLQRVGLLEVLIAFLEDEADALTELMRAGLAGELLTDPKGLATFQARQGALDQMIALVAKFRQLGRPDPLAPQANGRPKPRREESARRRVSI